VRIPGFAEAVRVATTQAISAVASLVEADHVFSPQPHERIGREVVSDNDGVSFHVNSSRWFS